MSKEEKYEAHGAYRSGKFAGINVEWYDEVLLRRLIPTT